MNKGELEILINNVNESMETLKENIDLLNNFLKDYGCNLDAYEYEEEKLRVGDYISVPRDEGGYDLYRICRVPNGTYILLNEETNKTYLYEFSNLCNLKEHFIEYVEGSMFYLVKETIDWDKNGYYLVYEDGSEMEFELYIQETEDGKYEVIITEQEDTYYDKAFNTIDEVALTLYKEHSFVKQLRCLSR